MIGKNHPLKSNDCEFCSELAGEPLVIDEKSFGNRNMLETPHFIVWPALGQIIEGQLLIVTKKHYTSIAALPMDHYPELERLFQTCISILIKAYGKPIFFEHGSNGCDQRAGACIDHAHIHVIPCDLDIRDDLNAVTAGEKIQKLLDLSNAQPNLEPYLFYQDTRGRRYRGNAPKLLPSQFIRRILAREVGNPTEWDWAVFPEVAKMKSVMRKVHEALE